MHWKTAANGKEYLYATTGKKERSLGVRNAETESLFTAHEQQITTLKDRMTGAEIQLEMQARISRALYLNRMPAISARILRRLDDAALLDGAIRIVGTHALFGYEAATGVLFEEHLTATEDLDLLWDPRRRLTMLISDDTDAGLLGLLRQVDRSFTKRRPYQLVNDDAFLVDLIRPERRKEPFLDPPRLSDAPDDLYAAPLAGLDWLINAPTLEDIVIGTDCWPTRIVTVDPRAYALHKCWLAKQIERDPLKRRRDLEQARAVADLAVRWLGLSFAAPELSALPVQLLAGLKDIQPELTS